MRRRSFARWLRSYFWLLSRTCGRPDLTVLLDLPGAVAFGRKGEDGIAETEAQRQEFLAIGRDLDFIPFLFQPGLINVGNDGIVFDDEYFFHRAEDKG